MSATNMIAASAYPARQGSPERLAGLIAARLRHLRKPFPGLFQSDDVLAEEVLARFGGIEILRVPAAWRLETSVKGERETARDAGLRRLAGYVAGCTAGGPTLHTVRPLIQTREGPNRWWLSVAIAWPDRKNAAAMATHGGRVRLRTCPTMTMAVMQVRGRPSPEKLEDADARLREALAETDWITAGDTILRLHRPPSVLPFVSSFQIAVPVAASISH